MNIRFAVGLALGIVSVVPPSLAADEGARLGEVVVTAQRREQVLKDVPMSVAAISGSELEMRSLSSIQDISFAVPGMAMREDGPGSYTIFMRGLSNQYGDDALVGVFLDETSLTLSGYDQMDARVLDLERIEVLKGPQGTLYGLGAVAGAVRYITKEPRLDAFEGNVKFGSAWISDGDEKLGASAVVNLPLVKDKFALRLAALVERDGGWQDQPQAGIEDGNNQDLDVFRLRALWQVTDAFAINATAMMHSNESKLGLGYENPDRTITVGIDRSDVLIPKEFEYDLYNLTATYDFGAAELLYAGSYIDYDHQYPFSYIGGPQTIYGGILEGTDERFQDGDMMTQELRLSSSAPGRFEWTVGASYRDSEVDLTAIYDTLYAGFLFLDAFYYDKTSWESYSVYGDLAWNITDRWQIGAGVRYFEDDQENTDGVIVKTDSFDSTDPRFYASFKATDDLTLYASAAKGFRSGGFNFGDAPGYEPESLWSYEIGAKGIVADGTLSFEAAAYYSDYSDMLRRGLVFIPETGQFLSITSNIGEVEVKGVEAGITWYATDGLKLYTTASYIDSEITEVNATDATSVAGDSVDYVPEFSATVGGQFDFDLTANVPAFVRVDYAHRDPVEYTDRTSFPAANVPQLANSIDIVDARVGATFGKFRVELWGTNLTDTNRWIDPYHGWTNANRTRPRTIGIEVAFDFN